MFLLFLHKVIIDIKNFCHIIFNDAFTNAYLLLLQAMNEKSLLLEQTSLFKKPKLKIISVT